jgi:hypothetical protein
MARTMQWRSSQWAARAPRKQQATKAACKTSPATCWQHEEAPPLSPCHALGDPQVLEQLRAAYLQSSPSRHLVRRPWHRAGLQDDWPPLPVLRHRRHCRRLPRPTSFASWRTPTSAPSTPSALPSCPRISSSRATSRAILSFVFACERHWH